MTNAQWSIWDFILDYKWLEVWWASLSFEIFSSLSNIWSVLETSNGTSKFSSFTVLKVNLNFILSHAFHHFFCNCEFAQRWWGGWPLKLLCIQVKDFNFKVITLTTSQKLFSPDFAIFSCWWSCTIDTRECVDVCFIKFKFVFLSLRVIGNWLTSNLDHNLVIHILLAQ